MIGKINKIDKIKRPPKTTLVSKHGALTCHRRLTPRDFWSRSETAPVIWNAELLSRKCDIK